MPTGEQASAEAAYWKVAPGEGAWQWDECREEGFIGIGWEELGDVSGLSRAEFNVRRDELIAEHDDWTARRLNQVWTFAHIQEGDRIVANRGISEVLGIGTVVGPYRFVPGVLQGHRLPVHWDDLIPRQVREGNWRGTLAPLSSEKFESIREAPPLNEPAQHIESPAPDRTVRPPVRVRAVLWKKLNDTDINVMSGEVRERVVGGTGQPDLRLRRRTIPDAKVAEFAANTPEAEVHGTEPVHVTVNQRPIPRTPPGSGEGRLELKGYGMSRDEISIKLQRPPHTNPRWADAAQGVAGDYIFIVRLEDGTFTSGWATAEEVSNFPAMLRQHMTASNQGVQFFGTESVPDDVVRILAALREHHNVLLYGPPGTGKTYLMQQARQRFLEGSPVGLSYDEDSRTFSAVDSGVVAAERTTRDSRWVTFHQSYSYEDFVGGRRPEPKKGTLLYLRPVNGVLLELAETASKEDGVGLLLVDEINRGNVSRIFGEYITLMEPDKRLKEDGTPDPVRTVSVRLPHTNDYFEMPHHVYTLATMNSVDRSVMPLDAALRRRFHTIELRPDYEALGRLFGLEPADPESIQALPDPLASVQDYGRLAVRLLYQVNLYIQAFIGPDFEAGHGFFWSASRPINDGDVGQVSTALIEAWNSRLLPHLQELFRSQPNLLGTILRADQSGAPQGYPYREQRLPEEVVSAGGVPRVETPSLEPGRDSEAILRFVANVP